MKVRELISILATHDPDQEVVMSCDSEGNSYSPLRVVGDGRYDAKERSLGLVELDNESRRQGYSEEDVGQGPVVVCLWP